MSIRLELAKTVRAFRLFVFTIPKSRVERDAWKFFVFWWAVVSGIIIFAIIFYLKRG